MKPKQLFTLFFSIQNAKVSLDAVSEVLMLIPMGVSRLKCQNKTPFREAVYGVVRSLSAGQVLSYGEVAKMAGYPGAARAVGTTMKENPFRDVPCHRVIRSDGRVGEYAFGGRKQKIARLRKEGVHISKHGRVILS